MHKLTAVFLVVAGLLLTSGPARGAGEFQYPYAPYAVGALDPQPSGWPLTEAERKFVQRPEFERRPGSEKMQHLPAMWPVTPAAGFWSGTSWLDTHAGLVQTAQASKGPIDVLLVGDSITMQWGAAWAKHFGRYRSVNIGIGGDKTQNVLWRLEHGGVDGLEPRLVVLLVGNNNMYFTPETGVEAAARGIQVCVERLRSRFPNAELAAVKIFPAGSPGDRFYQDIRKTNAALDALKLDSDPRVHVLDLWDEMVNPDGTIRQALFMPDRTHLTQDGGYELYARRLKPLVERLAGPTP